MATWERLTTFCFGCVQRLRPDSDRSLFLFVISLYIIRILRSDKQKPKVMLRWNVRLERKKVLWGFLYVCMILKKNAISVVSLLWSSYRRVQLKTSDTIWQLLFSTQTHIHTLTQTCNYQTSPPPSHRAWLRFPASLSNLLVSNELVCTSSHTHVQTVKFVTCSGCGLPREHCCFCAGCWESIK